MKKILIMLASSLLMMTSVFAQEARNSAADNILGKYYIRHDGEESKVVCTKNEDGTYKFTTYWCKNMYDKKGKLILDVKNPDKSLRNTPCNKMVIIPGLSYYPEKKQWKGKIYDPTRGIIANATVQFKNDKLNVRGSLLGIGMTVIWDPIDE